MSAIEEEADAYRDFRHTVSNALMEALDKRGSEGFSRELARIQRDIVNDGVDRLQRRWKELGGRRRARLGQYATRTLSVSVGLYFAFSPAALAGLMGGTVFSAFQEVERRIVEQRELREEPMYFIWKLGR